MFDFQGKTVLITGASRGLGKRIALAFAESRASIAALARNQGDLLRVVEEISSKGGVALPFVCDVCSRESVTKTVDLVMRSLGQVDVLVNCAGMFRMGPSVDFGYSEWKAIIDTNLSGTFNMCQAVGKHMLKRGRGKIINFASLLSFTAFPERAAYAASKGGVLQLTRVLGVEWIRQGVNVNAVAPGMIRVETPHPIKGFDHEAIAKRVPAGRVGTPDDIIGAAMFLASSGSDYMAGQVIVVDGGWLSYGYL